MTYKRNQYQTGVRAVNTGYEKAIKEGQAHVKSLQEKAKIDIQNQIRTFKDIRAETERAFKSETGIDQYEAKRFGELSSTVQEFLQGTWVEIGKKAKAHLDAKKDEQPAATEQEGGPPAGHKGYQGSGVSTAGGSINNTGIVTNQSPAPIIPPAPAAPGLTGSDVGGETEAIEEDDESKLGGAATVSNDISTNLARSSTKLLEGGNLQEALQTRAASLQVLNSTIITGNKADQVQTGGVAGWQNFKADKLETWFTPPEGIWFQGKEALKNPKYLNLLKELHVNNETERLGEGLSLTARVSEISRPLRKLLNKEVTNTIQELREEQYGHVRKIYAKNLERSLLKAAGKDGYQSSADLAVVLANIHDQVYPWITKGEYSKKTRHELAWDFVKDSLTTAMKNAGIHAVDIAAEFNKVAATTLVTTAAGTGYLSERNQFNPADIYNDAVQIQQEASTAIKGQAVRAINRTVDEEFNKKLDELPEGVDYKTWAGTREGERWIEEVGDALFKNEEFKTIPGMKQVIYKALDKLDPDLMMNKAEQADKILNLVKENGGGYLTPQQVDEHRLNPKLAEMVIKDLGLEIREDDPLDEIKTEVERAEAARRQTIVKLFADDYNSIPDAQMASFKNAVDGANKIVNDRVYTRFYKGEGSLSDLYIEESDRIYKEIEAVNGNWQTVTGEGMPAWDETNVRNQDRLSMDAQTLKQAYRLYGKGKSVQGLIKDPNRLKPNANGEYPNIVNRLARLQGVPPHVFAMNEGIIFDPRVDQGTTEFKPPEEYTKFMERIMQDGNQGEVKTIQNTLQKGNLPSNKVVGRITPFNKESFKKSINFLKDAEGLNTLGGNVTTITNARESRIPIHSSVFLKYKDKLNIKTKDRKADNRILDAIVKEQWPKYVKEYKTERKAGIALANYIHTGNEKKISIDSQRLIRFCELRGLI